MGARLCIVRGRGIHEGLPLKTPGYVIAIIVALAGLPLLSHALAAWCPPAGTVHSGLLTVDTGNYLAAMRYARGDYYSPFAACFTPEGAHDPTHYVLPHHHVYGMLGRIADFLRVPHFAFLALANAAGIVAYLVAAYAFLRAATPRIANRAFGLFSLGGGLGGVLYVGAALAGMTGEPGFGPAFLRYFLYELSEGPRFQPWLMAGRLYYTLPLATACAALTALLAATRRDALAPGLLAALLLAATAWLNFRVGPMALGAAVLLLAGAAQVTVQRRAVLALMISGGTAAGLALALWMTTRNPELMEGVARSPNSSAWFSPLISAMFWQVPLLIAILPRMFTGAPAWARCLGGAALGYAGMFALLYTGYQIYYGTYLHCNDVTAALRLSDWALLGAVPGAGWFTLRRRAEAAATEALPWIALWFLGLFCLAFSAWGNGWYLRFSPDRFMVFLGLPLAICGAAALHRLAEHRPTLARMYTAVTVVAGLASIGVTTLVSYGPLGFRTLQQHYSWTRYAFITEADHTVLAALGDGVVLSPSLDAPLAGDFLALRPGTRVVYGNGTLDYSRQVMPDVRAAVHRFFEPSTTEAARAAFVRTWCVDYIYCTDTTPVAPETLATLRALPWLDERAHAGQAALFAVRHDAVPPGTAP